MSLVGTARTELSYSEKRNDSGVDTEKGEQNGVESALSPSSYCLL